MPLSPEAAPFAWAWNTIQAGTAIRMNTASLWAELRDVAEQEGYQTGPGLWQAVNEMRSIASTQRAGAEAFQRANPDQMFTDRHAPPEINMRSAAQRSILPEYLVRFDLTFTDSGGNVITKTVSMKDSWRPGMTVGDVLDAVGQVAEGRANEYGQGLVGFDNLRPVMV